jgi:uncharacterized protein YndB with AHSA1/START domain
MSSDLHRPDGSRIRLSTLVDAPVERVWKAWADPADLSRWFADEARGEVVEGGTYTWAFRSFDSEIDYPVVRVDEPNLLVLAGEAPETGPFALEIRVEGNSAGTRVQLVNSGFPEGADDDAGFTDIRSGWTLALGLLQHYVAHHAGAEKGTVQRYLDTDVDPVHLAEVYFGEAHGLAEWLTVRGGIGARDEAVSLTLHDGRPLTGRVLARSDTEVAVSWGEEDAVLELKSFAAGNVRKVGLRLTGWGYTQDELVDAERFVEAAVRRLAGALHRD